MTRKRQKNRIANGDRFFQMHVWFLQSEAWRATNVYERSLYFELKQRYNGTNNGEIPLSHREAQAALNCSDKPIKAAFRGLIEKGFIRAAQIGTFHWKQGGGPGGRSTRWILTEYPVDVPLRSSIAEKSFMRWKPEPQKKARCDVGTPMVGREHTINHGMVGREHTMNAKVYAGSTR
ncbi:hypothetical protein [Sinorhizobium meliloti]|uniref:hypothetical protein n=1 Tax=Rhizobium meliloti TaxID=382 RepID=UPI00040A254E|nr:hypothetical protein [Sinorhizobium meliloti]MDE4619614.1 hypothetical protein [Sinorhizobium meliloti]